MKKTIVFLAFLFLFLILCTVTCPKKPDHHEAIVARCSQVDKEANDWNKLGSAIGGKFVSLALDARLDVKDCFVLSLGRIDGDKTVSIGILGHVFAFSKETIEEALK